MSSRVRLAAPRSVLSTLPRHAGRRARARHRLVGARCGGALAAARRHRRPAAGAPARRSLVDRGGASSASHSSAAAMRFWMRELLNGLSRYIEYDLRQDSVRAPRRRSIRAYFARMRTGDLMARLTNDLSAGAHGRRPGDHVPHEHDLRRRVRARRSCCTSTCGSRCSRCCRWCCCPSSTIKLGGAIHQRFEAVQEHFSELTTLAQENFAGVRIVRAYRQERAEIARFATLNETYLEKNMRLAQLYGAMNPMFGLLAGLSMVVVLGLGGSLVVRGTITVGAFVAFGIYLGMLTWPLIALGWVINLFQRGAASMTRLLDMLDARAGDPLARRAARTAAGARAGARSSSATSAFTSPRRKAREPRWVLRNVSFTAPAGATLGVVGATAQRQERADRSRPAPLRSAGGRDPARRRPDLGRSRSTTLRAEIGYVPQESFLFSDTIAANLAYGDRGAHARRARDATTSARARSRAPRGERDAERHRVGGRRRAARRHDARLSRTATTRMLGERGINLSGGQKQRLALARALARRPRIVLLDDALSAVDTHTEAEILRGLRGALAGRTAVIASHRVSAMRDASWIIVLDEGRIVEQGHARRADRGRRTLLGAAQPPAARGVDRGGRRVDRCVERTDGTGGYRLHQRVEFTHASSRHATCSQPFRIRTPRRAASTALEAQLKQAHRAHRRARGARRAQDAVSREHLARPAHAAHRGHHARRDPARRHPRRR